MAKSASFSIGWVITGTLVMLGTNLVGGFVAVHFWKEMSLQMLVGLALGCFALGGVLIGWQSKGSTILEAGLAAVLAIFAVQMIRTQTVSFEQNSLIGYGVAFLAAIIGAWIGEKVQGD